jgi:hypothetical protein
MLWDLTVTVGFTHGHHASTQYDDNFVLSLPGYATVEKCTILIFVGFFTMLSVYERGQISLWLYKENNKLRD